ncbi:MULTISPECIES: protein kinase [Selenomonas]|uniref:Protein kinase n=1 Tax=Selenomonas ruminis TaxID=2593411 RepID=A0A5D6W3G4_9FIRM|nr:MULTISPECIES: protein kinase [unclassified Selenomonas]MBQ1867121.1 protein kinase [Selenomonas sp.]MDD6134985.1 protein kinase [Selenomonadaceae bacterium]TYZ21952.1 protein kinase [Selenomonas sp. mPRGC5]SDG68111.1 hypothetical protein SAMN05216584_10955 [Selenomonas ruminantium]
MARTANYEEKIAKIEAKIAKKQAELKKLKAELAELNEQKAKTDYKELLEFMKKENMSPSAVLETLKK